MHLLPLVERLTRDAVKGVSADWTRPESRDANSPPTASACIDDRTKSKRQLLQDLAELRQRVRALESADNRNVVAIEPTGTSLGLRELLAVSPAIIYTTQASGDYLSMRRRRQRRLCSIDSIVTTTAPSQRVSYAAD